MTPNEEFRREVMDGFRAMHSRCDELLSAIAGLSALCPEHRKRTDRLELTVYGNGQSGLTTEVKILEKSRKRLWTVVITVISGVIAASGTVVAAWAFR